MPRRNYWQTVICQCAATIQMIRAAIEACPEPLWDDRAEGSPFWHLAYHALFYTDLYLSDDEKSFRPRDFHEDKTHFLPGDYQEFAGIVTTPETAYRKDQLLGYADHCLRKCEETFEKVTDERALERCGFWWSRLNVGEFLLNNLRHAAHQPFVQLTNQAQRGGQIDQPIHAVLKGHHAVAGLVQVSRVRSTAAPASAASSSPRVACAPSIRLDSTA